MEGLFLTSLTSLIKDYGLIAIFLLMSLESALIPIPSEVTMPFAGFLVSQKILSFWPVAFCGAFANLFGSLAAYYLGYKLGVDRIRFLILSWGKFLLIREKEFNRALTDFKKYGQIVVFTSRLLPVVRTYISLPAGIAKMPIVSFSILTFLGSLIWSIFLSFLGLKLGENWIVVEYYFRRAQIFIGILSVIFITIVILRLKRKR